MKSANIVMNEIKKQADCDMMMDMMDDLEELNDLQAEAEDDRGADMLCSVPTMTVGAAAMSSQPKPKAPRIDTTENYNNILTKCTTDGYW